MLYDSFYIPTNFKVEAQSSKAPKGDFSLVDLLGLNVIWIILVKALLTRLVVEEFFMTGF